jgi:hypothetical protein
MLSLKCFERYLKLSFLMPKNLYSRHAYIEGKGINDSYWLKEKHETKWYSTLIEKRHRNDFYIHKLNVYILTNKQN